MSQVLAQQRKPSRVTQPLPPGAGFKGGQSKWAITRYTHPARMVAKKKLLSRGISFGVCPPRTYSSCNILANIYNSYSSSSSASMKTIPIHSHTTTLLHQDTVVCCYHASAGSVGREPPTSDNIQPPLLVEAVRLMFRAVVLESTPDYDT